MNGPSGNELAAVPALAPGETIDDTQRLHDGVQNELVALIVGLRLAEEDPDMSPCLAGTLSVLGAGAQAVLDSVRQIACGIYPPVLADFGVAEALRAQVGRASIRVSLAGIAPRRTEEAEAAVYFSCLEAIQNVAKHAGSTAHARLGLHHEHGTLAVRLEDDGRAFDPARTPRWCRPETHPRSHPQARRHRQAHLRPRMRHRPDDFAAAATADSRTPLRQTCEFGSRGDSMTWLK